MRSEISGKSPLWQHAAFLMRFSFVLQSPRTCTPSMPNRRDSTLLREWHWKIWRKPLASNIPTSPYSSRSLERNGTSETGKVNEHKSAGHSTTSASKKAERKRAKLARPLGKETGCKSKPEKLVCRYCGSDDLPPSFIKRRDRRCRKCFSKRYGAAALAPKAKIKK